VSRARRVLVIGLDGLEPSLVFDRWRADLPNLSHLMGSGSAERLESCVPAVTVPAWASMTTGRDPGELGLYDFFNRVNHNYEPGPLIDSRAVTEPQLWDLLSEAGRQVVVIGVPPTFPVRAVNGTLVGCFFSSGAERGYAYPNAVADEIARLVGRYRFDVSNYLTEDKDTLLREIYDVTDQHFRVVRHFLTSRPWDFFMFVEVGPDRLHHGFWRHHDPAHPKHEAGSRFQSAVYDYYRHLDAQVGTVLELLDDDVVVLVVSDHGAQRMEGAILINEWLLQEGYLVMARYPEKRTRFFDCEVDWARTTAWAVGGYYGRVHVNVDGRNPAGLVPATHVDRILDELAFKISRIPGPNGRRFATRVYRPEQIYGRVRGFPPDLIVYFDDLAWRCNAELGSGTGALYKTDKFPAPDDANHAQHGICILYDPSSGAGRRVPEGVALLDVAPTVLALLGVRVPGDMRGAVIWE
jgi:predicted AlkP superfamily phosphohydrolase/phosphomutase